MPIPHRFLLLAGLLSLLPSASALAQSAPASIANSLVQFEWLTDSTSGSELVLFRADGTFQDLQGQMAGYPFTESQTLAPGSGTYTYGVAPGNPAEAVITVTSGRGGPGLGGGTQLVFYASNRGTGGLGTFYLSPGVAPTGAGNVSTRGLLSAVHPMEAGFVIEGTENRWVLVRGDGPSLAPFGVTDAVANPQVAVFAGSKIVQTLSVWSADPNLVPGYNAVFALAGAFPFPSGSADCAGLFELAPGAYTAQATTTGPEGEILLEVYILPFGG